MSFQCAGCAHYNLDWTCAAFGDEKIPGEIALAGFDHTKPYPGDNGIRYKPIVLTNDGGRDE